MAWWEDVLSLVVPPRCAACRDPSPHALCAQCTDAAGAVVLEDLLPVRLGPATVAFAAFSYDGVIAAAVRMVKRPGRFAAAGGLGELLWQVVEAQLPVGDLPRTWVPSSPAALRARGVEIPRLLAGPAAVPMLRCPRNRPDQTALDADARRSNPVGAFEATVRPPETVVLVDDVRTTGSTLLAAARALRAAGARRVVGVTLAAA